MFSGFFLFFSSFLLYDRIPQRSCEPLEIPESIRLVFSHLIQHSDSSNSYRSFLSSSLIGILSTGYEPGAVTVTQNNRTIERPIKPNTPSPSLSSSPIQKIRRTDQEILGPAHRIIMSTTDTATNEKVFKHPLGNITLLNDTNYAS